MLLRRLDKVIALEGERMVVSQGVSSQQQEEIKRLRNEISRLTVFRSTVRNYQEQNQEQEPDLIPSDLLAVSYNE